MNLTHGSGRPTLARSLFIGGLVLASTAVIFLQIRWMNRQRPQYSDTSLQQYAHITEKQSIRVFCDTCDGAGLVRDPDDSETMIVCPVCFGLGVHAVRFFAEGDVLCPDCRGLGRLVGSAFDTAFVCPRCKGRGVMHADWDKLMIPVQKARCPHCDGRGVLRQVGAPTQLELCPVCYGIGSRLVRRLDSHDEFCPACSGIGRLIDDASGEPRWCQLCGGRGLILSHSDDTDAAGVNP